MPPLPEVEIKLKELLNEHSRATTEQIAEVVGKDPAVAATILKLANSAAFAGLQQICDLSVAITRIGLKQLQVAVTTVLHKGHFEHQGAKKQKLLAEMWQHAVVSATAAEMLAASRGIDPHRAFISGLLHDSGKLLILRAADHLQLIAQIPEVVMDEMIRVLHAELGHKVLVAWNLPQEVCEVALYHHEPPSSSSSSLLTVVQAANELAHAIEVGRTGNIEPEHMRAMECLNLTDVEIAALSIDIEDAVAELNQAITG